MRFLLDTNVISELVAKHPTPRVVDWLADQNPQDLFLSVITIGEVKRGIERMDDSRKRERTLKWLSDEVLIDFEDRILPIDLDVMLTWGTLVAQLDRAGKPMPVMDSLLAAQAQKFRCVLVTRNERDFSECDIDLLNPWVG